MKFRSCDECTNRASVRISSPVEKLVCYECYNRTLKQEHHIKAKAIR